MELKFIASKYHIILQSVIFWLSVLKIVISTTDVTIFQLWQDLTLCLWLTKDTKFMSSQMEIK